MYLGLWLALGLAAQHVIFVRIWRFGASKPEKFSGPQAHVTGAGEPDLSLRESQAKVRHLMRTSPLGVKTFPPQGGPQLENFPSA